MSFITIILFCIYTYGLGHSITFFFKNSTNVFERSFMKLGIGLGVLPILLVILNLFHVPIDWKIILILSIILPLYSLFKGYKNIKLPKITKSNLTFLLVIIIFSLTLFMYVKGAFIYEYFENYDPWVHAVGVKYVSIEKNLNDPENDLVYIQPYPPGFDGLLGILHQTSPSLMWTVKFFNALIISLGIIFFYFFARNFLQSNNKALMATIILAMVPSYLSHFIWAHALVVTLFIVSLYCLVMMDTNKKWIYPTILVIGGLAVTQPSQPIKFFFMYMIYFIVKSIYAKRFLIRPFLAIIGGYFISFTWWAFHGKDVFLPRFVGFNKEATFGSTTNIFAKIIKSVTRAFPPDGGSATRPYTFNDFYVAKMTNMINNPVGIGIVISILAIISLVVIFIRFNGMKKSHKEYITIGLLWLLFTFLGINSMTFNLPVGLYAFRFWMLFALPLSLIAAEGTWFIVLILKRMRIPKIITVAVLVLLIYNTSGIQKYTVNTAQWPPGIRFTSFEEIAGYIWLKTLPVDTKVFAYSGDSFVIGFDKYSCLWCDNVKEFRKNLLYTDVNELHTWLLQNEYEYLILDGMSGRNLAETFGENITNTELPKRFDEITTFPRFSIVHQTPGMAVFRIQ